MSLRELLALACFGLAAPAWAQTEAPATPKLDALKLDAPAQKRTFTIEHGELVLPGPVVFETGSAKLSPVSDEVLEHVKAYLADKDYISLMRIEGHTDSDAKDGQALSEKRAMAVVAWLVGHGVACSRLLPVGFGSNKPVAPNDTPDNKAKNRRISAVNAALKGRAIGGMPVDGGGHVAGDPCK
jgi:OOP family OmpA-OmpF porin